MRSDEDPGFEPVPDDWRGEPVGDVWDEVPAVVPAEWRLEVRGIPLVPTGEEVAFAEELLRLQRAEEAAERAEWAAAGYAVPGDPGFGPIGDGPEGAAWDDGLVELDDEAALVRAVTAPVHEADLMLLASIDPRSLSSRAARLDYLKVCDRVGASVAARRADAVVALAGEASSEAYLPEVHLEHEIAVARRTSRYSAGKAIETARALATVFPGFAAALRDGEISEVHCAILVERTRMVTDPETLARIEARVLPKARRLTAGQFAGELAKAIAALDRDAAARVRKARESRRVWARQLEDGLGALCLIHDWPIIESIKRQVTADGRALQLARRAAEAAASAEATGSRQDDPADASGAATAAASDAAVGAAGVGAATTDAVAGDPAFAGAGTTTPSPFDDETLAGDAFEDATADACRADAFAARILGTAGPDGSSTWDRSEMTVTVDVVIDLGTLRGEADNMARLDGQPVPGEIGREVARFGTWWRRFVTDPVDGHLLDYGRAQYLPESLRRFVFARDGGCRAPYCTVQAESRLQLDHAQEWPDGESSTANTGALCTTCHQLKTAGYADITDSQPDGSCTWRTAWGQTIHVPPRPVLDDPDPPPAEPEPPPLEPPPF